MLRHYSKTVIFSLAVVLSTACKTYFPAQETSALIKVDKTQQADTLLLKYYKPYKDSLDKIMKIQLAELDTDLTKKLPEIQKLLLQNRIRGYDSSETVNV